MAKKFKSAASSSRVQTGALGAGFGSSSAGYEFGSVFGASQASQLSYVYEPPDLSTISDSSVVVSFKNLQKKDDVTKAKALDDLLTYIRQIGDQAQGIDEGIIGAWVKLYARTSIDNARQVRQRAHNFQGLLTTLCGKRIAKSLPSLIGPWLCGLQDNDKLVVRSAQEALSVAFPTEEKRLGVWKVYHQAILDYCTGIVLNEDAKTLSDERVTNEDDAESKYSRTVGCAISTITQLLSLSSSKDPANKVANEYDSVLDSARFWSLAASKDAFTRQSVYRATSSRLKLIEQQIDEAVLKSLSQGLLGKGLRTDQTGSGAPFVQALNLATKLYPEIWTKSFTSKKRTALQSLEHFFKNLPSGTTSEFWTLLGDLMLMIPSEAILQSKANGDKEDSKYGNVPRILRAFHHGITRRENFRSGLGSAWKCYLALSNRLGSLIDDKEVRIALVADMLFPLIRQFVLLGSDNNLWTVTDTDAFEIAKLALIQATCISSDATTKCITALSTSLIEMLMTSLPEQSRGFLESQHKVEKSFSRWSRLKIDLMNRCSNDEVSACVHDSTYAETTAAIGILKTRIGKPFGATEVLASALLSLNQNPNAVLANEMSSFLSESAPNLIGSPSTGQLLQLFLDFDAAKAGSNLYGKSLRLVSSKPDSQEKDNAFAYYLKSSWPSNSDDSALLSDYVKGAVERFDRGDISLRSQLESALTNSSTPPELTDRILTSFVDTLSVERRSAQGIQGINLMADGNPEALRKFLNTEKGSILTPRLLVLSHSVSSTELKQKTEHLNSRLRILVTSGDDSANYINALLASIRDALTGLELDTHSILNFARQVLSVCKDDMSILIQLLPTHEEWLNAIKPHLTLKPDPALSITNDLGGAISLVEAGEGPVESTSYDSEGYSRICRVIQYFISLMKEDFPLSRLGIESVTTSLTHLAIFNQIATDALSSQPKIPLWDSTKIDSASIVDILSNSQSELATHVLFNANLQESLPSTLLNSSKSLSSRAYYNARAYVTLMLETIETYSLPSSFSEEDLSGSIKSGSVTMHEIAQCIIVSQLSSISKPIDSLVSELGRTDFDKHQKLGFTRLVLLNRLFKSPSFNESTITQKHRLVLFVKSVVSAIDLEKQSSELVAEELQCLLHTMPLVHDIFDNFWDDIVEKLIEFFTSAPSATGAIHAALKLYSALKSLSRREEASDDLMESWQNNEKNLHDSLFSLLLSRDSSSNTSSQPYQIVDGLLGRLVGSVNEANVELDRLYPMLGSRSHAIQEAVFKFLHKKIPRLQQQVVMDAALTKDFKASVSTQLLDLAAATAEDMVEIAGEPFVPSHLQQIILSWRLIFDHWVGASYQVRNDYVECVKASGKVDSLIEVIFDHLITNRLKPFDASKTHFEKFDLDDGDGVEQHLLRSLSHLYLMALQHIPVLVRNWYTTECPRSLERPAREWTEKYMSPKVISAELAEVSMWAPKQETDTPLEIKVAPAAREVTAMYPVDEQMAAIKVSLPADYPLSPILVADVNRVGTDEKKWRAWLINAQGTMNFASSSGGLGAVTDGLVAWRRNVTGTLKGQSECAICYSIVNADRQLPTKKCGTCKNSYHGTCLYRWFKSSGGSSCPLCRNAFNYG